MKPLLLFFTLLINGLSFAQITTQQIDSVKKNFNLSDDYVEAFNKLKDTIFYFFYEDINKAEEIIPYLEYYAGKINDNKSKGIYYQNYGYLKEFNFEIDSAIYYLNKSVDYFIKDSLNKDTYYHIENIYNAIGIIYDDAGLYKSAIEYHLKAIKLSEQTYNVDPENKTNNKFLAAAYNDIAQTYSNINDSVNAELYFNKSITFAQNHGFKSEEATNKFNYAVFLLDIGNHQKALPLFEETKAFLKEEDFNSYLIVNINEAKINFLNKNYNKAIEICNKTILEAEARGYHDITEHSYAILSAIYSERNDIKKAIEYKFNSFFLCSILLI